MRDELKHLESHFYIPHRNEIQIENHFFFGVNKNQRIKTTT